MLVLSNINNNNANCWYVDNGSVRLDSRVWKRGSLIFSDLQLYDIVFHHDDDDDDRSVGVICTMIPSYVKA